MIINILYCIFFGILDFTLYALITGTIKIEKRILWLIIIISITVIILHAGLMEIYLMKPKDFFGLLMFSVSLVILYYGSKLQDSFFATRKENFNQKIYETYMLVFDFVRYKLIYIMIYIYQFLAVWNESYR